MVQYQVLHFLLSLSSTWAAKDWYSFLCLAVYHLDINFR